MKTKTIKELVKHIQKSQLSESEEALIRSRIIRKLFDKREVQTSN